MSISGLYESFNEIRNTPVHDFIEPKVVADANSSPSQIIGLLIDSNTNDIFIPLSGKVAAITTRDILGIKNITSSKPSTLGKIIPSLNSDSTTADAIRLMSLYRLRALPIIEKTLF
jgi:hypothetical protein